jgi:hypothetical protein
MQKASSASLLVDFVNLLLCAENSSCINKHIYFCFKNWQRKCSDRLYTESFG